MLGTLAVLTVGILIGVIGTMIFMYMFAEPETVIPEDKKLDQEIQKMREDDELPSEDPMTFWGNQILDV